MSRELLGDVIQLDATDNNEVGFLPASRWDRIYDFIDVNFGQRFVNWGKRSSGDKLTFLFRHNRRCEQGIKMVVGHKSLEARGDVEVNFFSNEGECSW